jgi:hypothetical protein
VDGDDLSFERRGEDGSLFVHFRGGEPKRTSGGCFAKALLGTHLEQQKAGLTNLLALLFKGIEN